MPTPDRGGDDPQSFDVVQADGVLESVVIDVPVSHAGGVDWPVHKHADHELLSSVVGTLRITTDRVIRVVPPGSAFWLPASSPHAVHASAGTSMRCTWFLADALPDALSRPAIVQTTPLLDDVLRHLSTQTGDRRRRGEAFALDLLSLESRPDDGLPRPRSAWLRTVTDQLAATPSDTRTVEQWAAAVAVSTAPSPGPSRPRPACRSRRGAPGCACRPQWRASGRGAAWRRWPARWGSARPRPSPPPSGARPASPHVVSCTVSPRPVTDLQIDETGSRWIWFDQAMITRS